MQYLSPPACWLLEDYCSFPTLRTNAGGKSLVEEKSYEENYPSRVWRQTGMYKLAADKKYDS